MNNFAYIIMGVSGCGKSSIGKLLARQLGISFFDGDDFHSEANILKMTQGTPLTDEDRTPWLQAINKKCNQEINEQKSAVFACSALKETYRKILSKDLENQVVFIFLKANKNLIIKRLSERENHFMPTTLIESQFMTLEEPKNCIEIDASLDPKAIVTELINKIAKSEFGVIGMGVMGKSLARNFAKNGIKLSLYNREVKGIEENIAQKTISAFPEFSESIGFNDLALFVASLEKPRKIILMIKAGADTDIFIENIAPFLETGDILIDGGNSHYLDTEKRIKNLEKQGIYLIGAGISGGENGALHGPSIMPSGPEKAYTKVAPFLQKIAAKDKLGNPCCTYVGKDGSGHYIKMVHNGIEYAEMQLLAETYAYFRYVAKKSPEDIAVIFQEWNAGNLSSYLLEITAKLLLKKEGNSHLIDLILDVAGNKGTGNWTTVSAAALGVPSTVSTAALFARYVSTIKEKISLLQNKKEETPPENTLAINSIKNAYELARIINHQQGFMLLQTASEELDWDLNIAEIARIWTNGCIIKSALMEDLSSIFQKNTAIFLNTSILEKTSDLHPFLKDLCIQALQYDVPIPCFLASLDYVNTLANNFATANIIQAQRDFFGAHQYQKRGDASGKFYHTIWE